MVFGIFGLAIELREAKHGNILFAGEHFQPPSDFGDLFLAWVFGVIRFDQLEIVDDDQAEFLSGLFGFHLGDTSSDSGYLADGSAR
jgi:hypothetical protein